MENRLNTNFEEFIREEVERLVEIKLDEKLRPITEKKVKELLKGKQEFYSTKETCKMLNISRPTLHKYITRGEIVGHWKSGRLYFRYPDILKFQQSGILRKKPA